MDTVTQQQILDFQQQIFSQALSYNIAYLSIAITIILVFLGLFSIFNLRPLSKRMDKQEIDINASRESSEDLKKDVTILSAKLETDINNLKNDTKQEITMFISKAEERLSVLEKRTSAEIVELKERALFTEIDSLWSQHYIWKVNNVPINILGTLVDLIEKNIEYKFDYLIELALDKISETLDGFSGEEYRRKNELYPVHERLIKTLSQLKNYKEKAKLVYEKAENLFKLQSTK